MSEDDTAARATRVAATLAEARQLLDQTRQFAPAPEREWLQRAIAAAIDQERERQRALLAEIVAHLQRQFEGALTDIREEFEAKLAKAAAAAGADLLAAKSDLCRRMEATILEMRRCLNAADDDAADSGIKVLN